MALSTNTIPAGLQLTKVLEGAMRGFRRGIAPVRVLSTQFQANPLQGNDKVAIPYYPLHTDDSVTRAAGASYKALAKDTSTGIKEITVNQSKLQAISFTSQDFRRQPAFDPEQHGVLMGEKLAQDVIAHILSVVTVANFAGDTIDALSAVGDFDVNDAFDLQVLCDDADWPEDMRGLILKPSLYSRIARSNAALEFGRTNNRNTFEEGEVPKIAGFDTYKTTGIPTNDEGLIGIAAHKSAILVAFAPVEPHAAVRANMSEYQILTDEYSDLTLEYREFGDPDTDEVIQVIECHYGFDVGEAAGIKRIALEEAGSGS